jgi:hypothetical protein
MASERRPLSTAYASRQVFESPVLEDLEYTTTQSGDSLEVERERLDRDTTFDAPEYASQSSQISQLLPLHMFLWYRYTFSPPHKIYIKKGIDNIFPENLPTSSVYTDSEFNRIRSIFATPKGLHGVRFPGFTQYCDCLNSWICWTCLSIKV